MPHPGSRRRYRIAKARRSVAIRTEKKIEIARSPSVRRSTRLAQVDAASGTRRKPSSTGALPPEGPQDPEGHAEHGRHAERAQESQDHGVGKAFGNKFRPWEAVKSGEKIASVAGKAGNAVPFLAAALDFYIQYREEKAKEEKARYLANIRFSLRSAFADQARVEGEALEDAIAQVSEGPVASALGDLDERARCVSTSSSQRTDLTRNLAELRAGVVSLRLVGRLDQRIIGIYGQA